MAKTVVKVFYERFIAVFGAPTKLLSNRGANFTSALVEELCSTFGIQKCRTMAYHTQCNGQVERFHQTLFCMIGKLSCDKKAQWEQHLPKLLQAYNSTRSAVTGYSLHYLMFGRRPHLPVNYYFLKNCEAKKQKCYYDRATSTAQLVPGYVVLMKNDAFQEKQKVKDRWSKTEYVVVCQVVDGVPAYEVKDEAGSVKTIHRN